MPQIQPLKIPTPSDGLLLSRLPRLLPAPFDQLGQSLVVDTGVL